jgi:hypothetical protein
LLAASVDFESPSRPPLWLRSSSFYLDSFGIRVTSGDLISAVILLKPNFILEFEGPHTQDSASPTRESDRGQSLVIASYKESNKEYSKHLHLSKNNANYGLYLS